MTAVKKGSETPIEDSRATLKRDYKRAVSRHQSRLEKLGHTCDQFERIASLEYLKESLLADSFDRALIKVYDERWKPLLDKLENLCEQYSDEISTIKDNRLVLDAAVDAAIKDAKRKKK